MVVPPQSLADVPYRQAAARADAVAFRFGSADITYADLHRRALALAGWLARRGLCTGDRVAWLGFNHPDQVALLFACARLGLVLAPLNFRLAPPEWDAVLADCAPRLLLHDAGWRDAAAALASRNGLQAHDAADLDDLDDLDDGYGTAGDESARHAPDVPHDMPVLLVYTSGTTGTPKGAVHTQANLLANIAAARAVQRMAATDVVLTVLPLFHVGGLCIQTLPALAAGARVVLHARFDPGAWFDSLAADRPTLTLLVPAVMQALVAHPRWADADLSCLRAAWAGSSLLPQTLVDAFHARGVPVCNVYGATETGPFSIALAEQDAVRHAGACGWPAPEVEARLHDVKDGVGEVLLRSRAVVRHYWPDRPALDADNWFHSGDLGRVDAQGCWRIVGRAKDMIISGGENIYPAEIENALAVHPDVAECAVLGVADPRWGEAVVAAVVPRAGCAVDAQALQAWLAGRVARYKLPRRYVALDALPRTALGKVQKSALLEAVQ